MVSKKITALTGSGQTQPETSQKDIYPEIIPLDMGAIAGKPAMVTDARNLHKFLGNKDQFATWIKQRIEQYGFTENVDYETYLENSKKVAHALSTVLAPIWRKNFQWLSVPNEGKRLASISSTVKNAFAVWRPRSMRLRC